jgi:cardiolipin synthase A/B
MLNMRERTDVLFKRFSRVSLLRLVGKVILGVLTSQVLTAAVLLVIAALGKRRKHEIRFPHQPFEEVRVGENSLQLYSYGRDLYDAMLEAIDAAQESIYLVQPRRNSAG